MNNSTCHYVACAIVHAAMAPKVSQYRSRVKTCMPMRLDLFIEIQSSTIRCCARPNLWCQIWVIAVIWTNWLQFVSARKHVLDLNSRKTFFHFHSPLIGFFIMFYDIHLLVFYLYPCFMYTIRWCPRTECFILIHSILALLLRSNEKKLPS